MTINQTLGDYELLALVGDGGQGRVYKAFDTKLKQFDSSMRGSETLRFTPRGFREDFRRKQFSRWRQASRCFSAFFSPSPFVIELKS